MSHHRSFALALATLTLAACADDATLRAPTAPASHAASPGDHGSSHDSDHDSDHEDGGGAHGTRGAVFSMSNLQAGNSVVMFDRAPNGMLSNRRQFATGGTGSGGFEDTADGLVLGSARGESAPNNLIGAARLLFATNAGSNTISVFRVTQRGLDLLTVTPSGGEKPVSVTVNRGLLYVLHSGEFVDGEIVLANCTTGNLPSITGFRVNDAGQLTPIPGSTRQLSGDRRSGCAQVSFNPAGTALVVTERLARDEDPTGPAGDEGVINTFAMNADGTPGTQRIYDATGEGPFGFTFNKTGALFTTEQFDGPLGPGRGAAAGYSLSRDGTLMPASPSVNNGGTDSCWFVVSDNGRYGYVTSFFGAGQISTYRVRRDGGLELQTASDDDGNAGTGASDLSLDRNSRHLYQLNSLNGRINAYRVGGDGGLTFIQTVAAHAPSATAASLGISAY